MPTSGPDPSAFRSVTRWRNAEGASIGQPQVPAIALAGGVRLARHQGRLQDLLDRGDEADLEVLPHVVRDVLLDRLLVTARDEDFLDAEAVGRQDLLLDAADREDAARERHLARHRDARP